jgi:hypothetical protein
MSQRTGTKRTRTEQPNDAQVHAQVAGHDELMIAFPELQTRLGQKYCDEAGLLALLLAHGIVRRVRTISVMVQPLGGDSFKIKLNAAAPSVGEAKAEIARTQGTSEARQELYKVAVRADGSAVREDDAEPEPLDDDTVELLNGQMVAMAVKEPPLVWRTCDEKSVTLSEGGAVATFDDDGEDHHDGIDTLVTSGVELTAGKHYWEVEKLILDWKDDLFVGIARPNLDPNHDYALDDSNNGWFIWTDEGSLCGNGKKNVDRAGDIEDGARVGVLLDLDEGSLRFFVNGVQHGPGYPAGSVTGPVVCAVSMYSPGTSARILPQDTEHGAGSSAEQGA